VSNARPHPSPLPSDGRGRGVRRRFSFERFIANDMHSNWLKGSICGGLPTRRYAGKSYSQFSLGRPMSKALCQDGGENETKIEDEDENEDENNKKGKHYGTTRKNSAVAEGNPRRTNPRTAATRDQTNPWEYLKEPKKCVKNVNGAEHESRIIKVNQGCFFNGGNSGENGWNARRVLAFSLPVTQKSYKNFSRSGGSCGKNTQSLHLCGRKHFQQNSPSF